MAPSRSLVVFVVALSSVLVLAGDALAQPSELDRLERQLDQALAELSTADCDLACRSLESMIRAADRICELDPGPRCDEARRKVEDVARRVRDACPECAPAGGDDDDDEVVTRTTEPVQPEAMGEEADAAPGAGEAAAHGPPAEDAGAAGCAACSVGRGPDGDTAWLALIALAAAAAVRRRWR